MGRYFDSQTDVTVISDRGGKMRSVREVMESRSVAVFGASQDPSKPGALLMDALYQTGV